MGVIAGQTNHTILYARSRTQGPVVTPESLPKHRVHLPDWRPGQGPLATDRGHYLTRVLRLRAGDRFVGFDGRGRQWLGRVIGIERGRVVVERGEEITPDPEPTLEIVLVQAVARGDRMDYALQKATELGVSAIEPVFAERTEVRLSGRRLDRRLDHWRAVVTSACEQCGRTRVPDVAPARTLNRWLDEPADLGSGTNFLLLPSGAGLRGRAPPQSPIRVLIGPEGGLTAAEVRAAVDAGFDPLVLGPRILRCETAGPAAIAAIQTLWGDLG